MPSATTFGIIPKWKFHTSAPSRDALVSASENAAEFIVLFIFTGRKIEKLDADDMDEIERIKRDS